jgi:glutamate/tyrosine decarboxylase-like PLP-dependent enzyme
METISPALDVAVEHARAYLASLATRSVAPAASYEEIHARFDRPLPATGAPPEVVVAELVEGSAGGLLAIPGPRFFGFVAGGSLPAALAADWLVSAWDQNTALGAPTPAISAIEEVAARWLVEVLGLPPGTSVGITTGCQMAHFTCLAAARHQILAKEGWDVGTAGLTGAPNVRVVVGEDRHASIDVALRYLGLGAPEIVESDEQGRLRPDALAQALSGHEGPLIVCAQAGEIHTGAFDPLGSIADIIHDYGGWLHVDGAFGLWLAASRRRRSLLDGYERADSWATDGHKWLNTPYDGGFAFTAHPATHRAAMTVDASYLVQGEGRDPMDWVPEFSRRARATPVWAALRSLGRDGVEALVDRCCDHAERLAAGLRRLPGVDVLNDVVSNQVMVRFPDRKGEVNGDDNGDDDERTSAILAAVQRDGTCYPSPSTWRGKG